jgi:hypothetical protein
VRLTRRNLILGLVATLGLDPSGVLRTLGGRARDALAQLAPVPPSPVPGGLLSEFEIEALVAFAEVLVEGRPLSPVERGYLIDHISVRTAQGSGYYVSLYQTAVRFLDRLAGGRFSSLGIAQRILLTARHRLVSSDLRPGEHLTPFPEDEREVRARTVPDLIGGYYGSPAGWAVVGYGTFPGQCGDLARYTTPER